MSETDEAASTTTTERNFERFMIDGPPIGSLIRTKSFWKDMFVRCESWKFQWIVIILQVLILLFLVIFLTGSKAVEESKKEEKLLDLVESAALASIPLDIGPPCSNGYTFLKQTGFCYKFHISPLTFGRAEQSCQSEGGHLASIHSEEEHLIISGLYHYGMVKEDRREHPAWIGMYHYNGTWKWTDNSTVDYTCWKYGDPTDTDKKYYGFMHYLSIGWKTDEGFQKSYICKKPAILPPEAPKSQWEFLEREHKPCWQGYTWLEETGQCYKAYTSLGSLTYENATKICEKDDGYLASVHSETENMFIIGLYMKNRDTSRDKPKLVYDYIQLGMQTKNGANVWSDFTPVDYTNWAVEETGDKNSAMINVFGGKWLKVTTPSNRVFICKRH